MPLLSPCHETHQGLWLAEFSDQETFFQLSISKNRAKTLVQRKMVSSDQRRAEAVHPKPITCQLFLRSAYHLSSYGIHHPQQPPSKAGDLPSVRHPGTCCLACGRGAED